MVRTFSMLPEAPILISRSWQKLERVGELDLDRKMIAGAGQIPAQAKLGQDAPGFEKSGASC
jgi:hypothetical protein